MTLEKNKALILRFVEEVWNQGNEATAHAILDTEYAAFEIPFVATWRTAFPDLHFTADEMIAEGDTIAARATIRGTHTGPFEGETVRFLTTSLQPTGKQIEFKGIWFFRVQDGERLRAETEGVADWLTLLRQLGVAPSPQSA